MDLQDLKQELDLKCIDLKLAAEIGSNLLEQNKDLEEQLEKLSHAHCNAIEKLEQEKYSLQLRLNARDKSNGVRIAELESLREVLENEYTLKQRNLKTLYKNDNSKLQETIKVLNSDLDKAAIVEIQLNEKVDEVKTLLSEAHELLHSQQDLTVGGSEETTELYSIIAHMEQDKAKLRIEYKEMKDELLQIIASRQCLLHQVDELSEELTCKKKEAISYYNALEKCREEAVDMKIQLDAVKLQDVDTQQKGNSLFGEVEDRRKELERKYISMKVQSDGAKRQLIIKREQITKMKFQIATLLRMSASRADSNHIERLREELNQSRSQVKILIQKLNNKNKQVVVECGEASDDEDKHNYADYLKQQMSTTRNELCQLKEELQTHRLLLMSKSDCLVKCERELYMSLSLVDKQRAENIKLTLKVDELKLKLSATDMEKSKSPRSEVFVEKIPMAIQRIEHEQFIDDKNNAESSKVEENNSSDVHALCLQNIENKGVNFVEKNTRKLTKYVPMSETDAVFVATVQVDMIGLKADNGNEKKLPNNSLNDKIVEEFRNSTGSGTKQHKVIYVKSQPNECAHQ